MATEVEPAVAARRNPFSRIFYGWYIVAAGIGVHGWIAMTWIYGMQLFVTPLRETFGWSTAAIGFAFSLNRIEGSVLTPIEGVLVDKYGPRVIMLIGGIAMGVGFIVLSMIDTLFMFYVGMLIVAGASSATLGVPRTWAIVQWFRRQRGRAMGIGNIGGVFGGPLLLIIVWMIAAWGWRQAFFVLGIGSFVILVPLALVYRTRPEQYGMLPDGDPVPPAGVTPAAASAASAGAAGHGAVPRAATADGLEENFTTKQALKTPAFWILVVLFGAQMFGTGAINVHLVSYLETPEVGFTTWEAASVLSFFTVLSIFGRLGGGWAIDRYGARATMAVLVALMAVGFLVLVNMNAYWMVPVYALIYGTAFGGLMTGRSVIIGNFFGRNSFGTISGILNSATVPAAIFAPVFMGWVFDTTGSYRPAIWVMIVISLIAVPLTMLARPPKPRQAPPASTPTPAPTSGAPA